MNRLMIGFICSPLTYIAMGSNSVTMISLLSGGFLLPDTGTVCVNKSGERRTVDV